MSNFIPKFTSFGTVGKQAKEKLSHIEFNEIANQLADQGNHNTEALIDVYQYQATSSNQDTQQNQRLDNHDTRLNNLDAQVQTVREETTYHDALAETRNKMQDGRLDTGEVRLNTVDERVNNVRDRLAKTEDIVAGLQDSVIGGVFPNGSVEDRHLSNAEGQIKHKVTDLEAYDRLLDAEIANLKSADSSLDTRVTNLEIKPENGSWFKGAPRVNVDGVMDIGKVIDFHATNDGTSDYSYRMFLNSAGNTMIVTNHFVPESNGVVNCGGENNRWAKVYGAEGNFSGTKINSYQYTTASRNFTITLGASDGAKGKPILIFQDDQNVGWVPVFRPEGNGTHELGHTSHRWANIFSVNALNTSDSSYKENIKSVHTKTRALDESSYGDRVHDFMKTMPLYTFDYKTSTVGQHQMGFLADELLELNPEIASNFVYDVEDGAMTSTHAYVATLHLAFQEEVKKREFLEKELELIKSHLGL